MSTKQVKLNLKPEIFQPLAKEAKRLKMPVAAVVRMILANSMAMDNTEKIDNATHNKSLAGSNLESSHDTEKMLLAATQSLEKSVDSLAVIAQVLASSIEVIADSLPEQLNYNSVSPSTPSTQNTLHPVASQEGEPTGQPINQPISQPASQSVSQTLRQSTSQSMGQPTSQPMSQPVSQSISQPLDHTSGQQGALPVNNYSQDVFVEDISQSSQPQELRKITISLS